MRTRPTTTVALLALAAAQLACALDVHARDGQNRTILVEEQAGAGAGARSSGEASTLPSTPTPQENLATAQAAARRAAGDADPSAARRELFRQIEALSAEIRSSVVPAVSSPAAAAGVEAQDTPPTSGAGQQASAPEATVELAAAPAQDEAACGEAQRTLESELRALEERIERLEQALASRP